MKNKLIKLLEKFKVFKVKVDDIVSVDEMNELKDKENQFAHELANLMFKSVREIINKGGCVDNETILSMIDRDLCNHVSPVISGLVVEKIQNDKELYDRNQAAFEKYTKQLAESTKANISEEDQFKDIFNFSGKIDPNKLN